MQKQLGRLGIAALAIVALSRPLFAQITSGNLTGTVFDATGASIPDAAITATNEATGVVTRTNTTSSGQYRINNLLVGKYDISVTASGFSKAELKAVDVTLNQLATANVTLQVGHETQSVEVSAEGSVIDTSTAQIQTTYDAKQLSTLSMASQGSGVINLSLLQPGVATSGAIGLGSGPSVGGQRPRNNNFTIEGIDNNEKSTTGPLVQVPNDAVAEFTVIANQFSPQYGHSSGGQFNQVIKSGTNSFHGMLYEYNSNKNYNAADNLSAVTNTPLHPRFDDNRFGGNFGGPIKKDKLFFFVDWEYDPVGQSGTTGYTAPTQAGYDTLAKIPGINTNNLQQYQKYLGAAPVANSSTIVDPKTYLGGGNSPSPATEVTIPLGDIGVALPNYLNTHTGLASVDYTLSDKDQLRGRFLLERQGLIDTAGFPAAFFETIPQNNYLVTVSEYHNFSPNLTNEFRIGFNRFSQYYAVPNEKFPGLDQFPNIVVFEGLGAAFGPDQNAPQYTVQNTYQLNDGINWTRGKHTLQFGFDGYRWISPNSFTQRSRGDYEYSFLSDYMFDYYPDNVAERSLGGNEYVANQWLYGFYGNDSWKLLPNLTVNIGLRWEYLTVPLGEQQQTLNAISNVPGLITFQKPVPQKDAFMPRIGIAYSPGTSGRTSFRAGFGENYDVLPDNFGILTKPPQFSVTVDCPSGVAPCTAPGGPAGGFLANGGISPGITPAQPTAADYRANTGGYTPNQTRPKAIQWNFGIQHVFAQNYIFDTEYIGTRGIDLPVQARLNEQSVVNSSNALPLFYSRPSQAVLNSLPNTLGALTSAFNNSGFFKPAYLNAGFQSFITSYQPWGNSTYHGWANSLTRRFSNGLQFIGSYTWSHNIDDSTAEVFSTVTTPRRPQDINDLRADRSSSALDHRQRFSLATIYDLTAFKNSNWFMKNVVSNWEIAPVYQYQTGTLYTVQSGADSNLNGDSAGDRVFVNPTGQTGVGSGTTALKNSAGATVAYLATNPNAQYIVGPRGTLPTGGRNTGMLNPINDVDLTLAKNLNFTERYQFQFAIRATNVFNHPQYVGGFLSDVKPTTSANGFDPTNNLVHQFLIPNSPIFGNPTQAFSSNPRSMQLSLKFTF